MDLVPDNEAPWSGPGVALELNDHLHLVERPGELRAEQRLLRLFGIVYVYLKTQQRTPKLSAPFFHEVSGRTRWYEDKETLKVRLRPATVIDWTAESRFTPSL